MVRFTAKLMVAMMLIGSGWIQPTTAQDSKPARKNYYEVTKWIVEVIGYGGRIDLTIGEYNSYQEASNAAVKWSKEHPKDLRLTRTREVKTKVFPPGKTAPKYQPNFLPQKNRSPVVVAQPQSEANKLNKKRSEIQKERAEYEKEKARIAALAKLKLGAVDRLQLQIDKRKLDQKRNQLKTKILLFNYELKQYKQKIGKPTSYTPRTKPTLRRNRFTGTRTGNAWSTRLRSSPTRSPRTRTSNSSVRLSGFRRTYKRPTRTSRPSDLTRFRQQMTRRSQTRPVYRRNSTPRRFTLPQRRVTVSRTAPRRINNRRPTYPSASATRRTVSRRSVYRAPVRRTTYRRPVYRRPTVRSSVRRSTYRRPVVRRTYRQPTIRRTVSRRPTIRRAVYRRPVYRRPTYRRPLYVRH